MIDKNGYVKIFNSFLDNDLFNQTIILSPQSLTHVEKLYILNDLAYRIQIEFCKNVYIITDRLLPNCELKVIDEKTIPEELPLTINNFDSVFLIDVCRPYFEGTNSWSERIIEILQYYKMTVFGFCSNKQIIKFYE